MADHHGGLITKEVSKVVPHVNISENLTLASNKFKPVLFQRYDIIQNLVCLLPAKHVYKLRAIWKTQIDSKTPNFEIFQSALYMKFGSIPFTTTRLLPLSTTRLLPLSTTLSNSPIPELANTQSHKEHISQRN